MTSSHDPSTFNLQPSTFNLQPSTFNCGKAKSTISKRLKGVRSDEVKSAEVQTEGGFQGVRPITYRKAFQEKD